MRRQLTEGGGNKTFAHQLLFHTRNAPSPLGRLGTTFRWLAGCQKLASRAISASVLINSTCSRSLHRQSGERPQEPSPRSARPKWQPEEFEGVHLAECVEAARYHGSLYVRDSVMTLFPGHRHHVASADEGHLATERQYLVGSRNSICLLSATGILASRATYVNAI